MSRHAVPDIFFKFFFNALFNDKDNFFKSCIYRIIDRKINDLVSIGIYRINLL